jgi:hypothetical protein
MMAKAVLAQTGESKWLISRISFSPTVLGRTLLSAQYVRWRDFRVDPHGYGLHGIRLEPGEVVRLTQDEVEAHPAWAGFGDLADSHPPMRGWLATAVCGEDGRRYGLLQLSDKSGGADFTAEDEDRTRELAAFTGATLDALRAARRPA